MNYIFSKKSQGNFHVKDKFYESLVYHMLAEFYDKKKKRTKSHRFI